MRCAKNGNKREDEKRPPVFIIVCKNTALAKVVHQWLAEDEAPVGIPPARLDGLLNANGNIRTNPGGFQSGARVR